MTWPTCCLTRPCLPKAESWPIRLATFVGSTILLVNALTSVDPDSVDSVKEPSGVES